MFTFLAILRGINVGGKNTIRMSALNDMFITLGFRQVNTYIQSGNVVFQSVEKDKAKNRQSIMDGIQKRFDLNINVQLLEKSELFNILEKNPFINDTGKDTEKLHITLLSSVPDKNLLNNIDPAKYLPDEFFIHQNAVYLYCPNGYGQTKLNNNFFENKLKTTATTRNLRTWNELAKISSQVQP